jgi:hypothetical protein
MNRFFGIISLFLALSVLGCAGGKNVYAPSSLQTKQSMAVSYWTGDGGRGMVLAVLLPQSVGLNQDQEHLPRMIQGVLVSNISKYSAITVQNTVIPEQLVILETLDPIYKDDFDIVQLDHIPHAGYLITGDITRNSTGYILQIIVTDTTDFRTVAAYSGNYTVFQLNDLSAINQASESLLTQMGVQLTDAAKNELRHKSMTK